MGIRISGYQVVPACGRQGHQNIRASGSKDFRLRFSRYPGTPMSCISVRVDSDLISRHPDSLTGPVPPACCKQAVGIRNLFQFDDLTLGKGLFFQP